MFISSYANTENVFYCLNIIGCNSKAPSTNKFSFENAYISMRHAFRPHYRAERFFRKRLDLKILLKVDHIENAFTSYLRGRSKTIKTHQNEIDDQNIAGAFVCSMQIVEFMTNLRHKYFYGFRTFLCLQSETHRNAGSNVDANRSMY